MQLSLSFPDSGYPDVLFLATKDSLAKDALEAAIDEWLIDPVFIELSLLQISFSDVILSPSCRLFSKGVVADSQLTVSLLRWIGKELLTDATTREKIGKLIEKGSFGSDRILRLDSPTFTNGTGCISFKKEWIPEGILNICFANPNPSITSTAEDFLAHSNISNIDLLGLQSITSVGNRFLYYCSSLKTVNLSCLQNVSKVGSHFLLSCTSLEFVDFCSFEKVRCINFGFLCVCSSLKGILNISGLRNVKSIGDSFLTHCSSLVSADISVFTRVKSIGSEFLSYCSVLENVDLGSFAKVTRINNHFLSFCSALKAISNICGLRNVKSIEDSFLYYCSSLVCIDLRIFTNVERIGRGFLSRCSLLETVDFCSFENVTCIDSAFLNECSSVVTIYNISGLRNVTSINRFDGKTYFLYRCTSLPPINDSVPGYECLSQELKEECKVFSEELEYY